MSEGARAYTVLVIIAAAIAWAVALSSPQYVGPRREYSGVYKLGFESSYFLEGAKAESQPAYSETDFGYLDQESIALPPDPCGEIAAGVLSWRTEWFEIRFIGRRKPDPARNVSGYPAEYIVERVIDIRSIEHWC